MNLLLLFLICVSHRWVTEAIESLKQESVKDFNPERGFTRYTQTLSSDMVQLDLDTLTAWKNGGISLLSRVFVLDQFVKTDISAEFLERLMLDLNTVRAAEMKVNLRFCYSLVNSQDASLSQIKTHIEQLKPYFKSHVDVINVLEAGFVGQSGEWYYSGNYNTAPAFIPTSDQLAHRKEILWALLDALPSTRMITVRTPSIKKMLCGSRNLLPNESFTEANCSRIGFHNDCILADNCYQEIFLNATERIYYARETLFVPSGGEASERNSKTDNCNNVEQEIARNHLSYLNQDYNPDTIAYWLQRQCYDSIQRKLGYRFSLKDVRVSTTILKRNKTLTLSFTINNIGSAPLYNPRGIEVILRHLKTSHVVTIPQRIDPRNWTPLTNQNIQLSLQLEEYVLPPGAYEILLNLFDPLQKASKMNRIALLPPNIVTPERYNLLGKVTVV